VDVEGSSVLRDGWDQPRYVRGDKQFIFTGEMAMRCNRVGGEKLGVKCGYMQGCYDDARPVERSWRCMVEVTVSMKTKRVGAATRQS